jgi:selenide,water dikinase
LATGRPIKLTSYASCAGCAGKIPAGALSEILRKLPASSHPDLLVGPEHWSDAGIFRLRDDLALVQTTDFFPPLVDDPYQFGQIAAANSLSDCYAMGGRPITCLNIVAFPDNELDIEILSRILAGGASKVAEAGAVIVGGHSVRDSEIKFGLAVTGVVHPASYFTNRVARPGDRLILTKPIGSGVMTSAAKTGKLAPDGLDETIAVMIQLNAGAAEAARVADAHAVTDITGFGLLGHACEMAQASGVTMRIRASAVPLLQDTLKYAASGSLTRSWKPTLENIGRQLRYDGVDELLVRILADAQTSGGLLIAVAADRVQKALTALQECKTACAVEIGEVVDFCDASLILTQ